LRILSNVKVFHIADLTYLSETILEGVEAEFGDNVKNRTSDIVKDGMTGMDRLGEEVKEIWHTTGEIGKELLEDVEEILGLGHQENHENKTDNSAHPVENSKTNSSSVAKNQRRAVINFI
jgi:hypothetical protein